MVDRLLFPLTLGFGGLSLTLPWPEKHHRGGHRWMAHAMTIACGRRAHLSTPATRRASLREDDVDRFFAKVEQLMSSYDITRVRGIVWSMAHLFAPRSNWANESTLESTLI